VLTAYGWRTGLTIQAVCLGVVFVVVLLVSSNAAVHDPIGVTPGRPFATGSGGARTRARTLLTRNVLAAGIFEIGTVGLFAVIPSWMPAILVEDAGMSESRAGFVTSLFSIVGMAAAFSVPAVAEKWGNRKRVILVGSVITVGALAALTICLATGSYVMVALLVPVVGLGVYTCEPLTVAGAVESVDSRLTGVVNGIVFGIPWFVSGFAYPYVVGVIRDMTGSFVAGFALLTTATVVTCAVASALVRDPSTAPSAAADALGTPH
jgi:cyanate permease